MKLHNKFIIPTVIVITLIFTIFNFLVIEGERKKAELILQDKSKIITEYTHNRKYDGEFLLPYISEILLERRSKLN